MTSKVFGGIVASVVSLVVACAAGVVLLFGGGAASGCTMPPPSGAVSVSAPADGWRPVGRFNPEQVGHAATIVAVGVRIGVPIRGWIVAVATAIQESDLRNLPGGARRPDRSVPAAPQSRPGHPDAAARPGVRGR